jgi:hypothetical protein
MGEKNKKKRKASFLQDDPENDSENNSGKMKLFYLQLYCDDIL